MAPHETMNQIKATIYKLREARGRQAGISEPQIIAMKWLPTETAELKPRLDQNARNSLKPHSSGGSASPTAFSLRKKAGKKHDAQKGRINRAGNLAMTE